MLIKRITPHNFMRIHLKENNSKSRRRVRCWQEFNEGSTRQVRGRYWSVWSGSKLRRSLAIWSGVIQQNTRGISLSDLTSCNTTEKHIGWWHLSGDMKRYAPHHLCMHLSILSHRDQAHICYTLTETNTHTHTLAHVCADHLTRTEMRKCEWVTWRLTHHHELHWGEQLYTHVPLYQQKV